MLNEESVKKFQVSLRGVLIQPNDEGYDIARKVYNGMIDRRPRLSPARTADVIAAVFCRQNNMLVAIEVAATMPGAWVRDDGLVMISRIKYRRSGGSNRQVGAAGLG
jgi:hypothetical protein